MIGGELLEDGTPAYREVVFTVPRQSGKTTLILAWELQRAIGWGSPQRIVYSAQSGKDAREKLMEDQAPIFERHSKLLGITKVTKGVGYESVRFDNGSLIKTLASSEQAGHGKTLDLAVKDEYFADDDDRRDQALIPAMSTKASAQMLTATTAGTEKSVPWNRKQMLGRQAARDGVNTGIAYFEWSADPDAFDPADEDAWWDFMPALGHTIQPAAIRHARSVLDESEFVRAYGNVPTVSSERIIPELTWAQVCSPDAAGSGAMTFGVDVNEDRSAAAIVAVSADRMVELVEHRPGLAWLPSVVAEIEAAQPWSTWVVDGSGPVASLVPEFERTVARLQVLKAGDLAKASAAFYDSVADATVRVRRDSRLDDSVAGAARRVSGDSWAWSRKVASSDSSPLVAATVALWMVESASPASPMVAWR